MVYINDYVLHNEEEEIWESTLKPDADQKEEEDEGKEGKGIKEERAREIFFYWPHDRIFSADQVPQTRQDARRQRRKGRRGKREEKETCRKKKKRKKKRKIGKDKRKRDTQREEK